MFIHHGAIDPGEIQRHILRWTRVVYFNGVHDAVNGIRQYWRGPRTLTHGRVGGDTYVVPLTGQQNPVLGNPCNPECEIAEGAGR